MLKELLEAGKPINMPLLVKDVTIATSRNGDPYARGTVGDSSASVPAVQWSLSDRQKDLWEAGTVVKIVGGVESYQGNPQIKVTGISPAPDDIDVADFYERCPISTDTLWKMFMELIDVVRGPYKGEGEPGRGYKLANAITAWIHDAPEVFDIFKKAPAARGMHHAYVGGLLEHSVGTAQVVRQLVDGRAHIDGDVAILGALIHDIGKTWEYQLSGEMTDLGKLQGHLFMGAQIADFAFAKYKVYIPEVERNMLTHIILSHHGLQEWGAIVAPKTPEAWLVHMADMIDVRLWCAEHHRPEEGWSWEKIKTWGGEVLLKGRDEE